ncbi:MAG: molybdenum cofactor biosynthesis protein MoaE [Betaproteobacteria bacterium]|nr:molybdenum cofactor biosynthesis protein MoaE [Betaproteobacteria bacterium]
MAGDLQIIELRASSFDPLALLAQLSSSVPAAALASFCGRVRATGSCSGQPIDSLLIEHYPGMAEQCMNEVAQRAHRRWQLAGLVMIHRYGELAVGEPIVLTAAAANHRAAAFAACRMMIDCLKSEVPFWKREIGATGSSWVPARSADANAAQAWQE